VAVIETPAEASPEITNAQASVCPAQTPDQERTCPSGSVADSDTAVPLRNGAEHVPENSWQSIPGGLETTRVAPFGLAPMSTDRVALPTGANRAVTLRLAVILTVQSSSDPVHAPSHPVNTDPGAG
jgi:hypothetical protein